ncbi:MAG TPA: sulfotransferase family 2 domain-containing protein [Methyloceanibacter sp.]|nr:sulfotransferase family 2 domain-containing protein [Methyloceanibacter sp.]
MLSLAHRCIFVHVQKTGGESIGAMLGAEPGDQHKHRTALELRALYGDEVWASCFKFAFVRNPWDRLVSWWSMIDAMRPNLASSQVNPFQRFILTRATTFAEFLLNCDEVVEDHDGRKHIFQNQIDYLADERGTLLVDYVGRFETLHEDALYIAERLGLSASLPHLNPSRHAPYARYYDRALALLVAKRYAPDIEAFGYSFSESA